MRLRTAIKIQKNLQEPWTDGWRPKAWKKTTIWESYRIGRKKWKDSRFPYIPSEEESEEQMLLGLSVLAEVMIEDEEEKELAKEMIWSHQR